MNFLDKSWIDLPQGVNRATKYPYDAPNLSFLLDQGILKPLTNTFHLAKKIPILAIGSNRSPSQLLRKFGKKETVADFLTAIAGTGISVSSGQLTASVTETDTLDSVTTRGATTTNDISVNKVTSTVSTGTAPLVVASTTKVANLNADKLDDKELTDIIAEATALAIALG